MSHTNRPTRRTRDLVVGVDGTPASANALRYAVKEAALSGGNVEVVHVIPDYAPIAGMYPIAPAELVEAGRAALETTLREVGSTSGATLATKLERGAVVKTLVTAGEHALEIVVGSDRRPVTSRLLTGNVSTGVAASAAVPVVSVPETWSADRETGTVLVGVKRPDQSEALLAEGFEVARRRGSRLVVLRAWRFPSAYDDIIVSDPATLAEWGDRARSELEDLVAPWRHSYPDVEVELRCVHDHPAQALVHASVDADELVIARKAHGFPAAAHLGSTARTTLLYAHCPVRVVPAVHVPVLPDLDLEAAGSALK
ncbi:universal stress protein [Nocardioides glacieisoli]|uniref:Universal stress protein n=1 Tax=Nocardioides glacieisoli TaxID=1168730 RepID=A0A4Q2RI69_9ACTN|nr:universal stress protein [Nocardioides glacieisoli]RYB88410.1 universal stress protein [Nocardioides glacieisoli]